MKVQMCLMLRNAQLGIFISEVSNNFEVTHELLGLHPMKGITQGTHIFEHVLEVQYITTTFPPFVNVHSDEKTLNNRSQTWAV